MSAAIVLWNTVYLERAIQTIKDRGETVDENLLQHLSPLGWEHINLTGDYHWETSPTLGPDLNFGRSVPGASGEPMGGTWHARVQPSTLTRKVLGSTRQGRELTWPVAWESGRRIETGSSGNSFCHRSSVTGRIWSALHGT